MDFAQLNLHQDSVVTSSMGFGAEKLGLLTLRFPKAVLIGVVLISGYLCIALPQLKFEGDVLRLMDRNTQSWQDYETLSTDFPSAVPDVFLLATSETSPPSAGWLARLQELQLDLQLIEGVTDVQSVFSLRIPDGAGGSQPLLNPFEAAPSAQDITDLALTHPLVPLFFRPNAGAALLSITLNETTKVETAKLSQVVNSLTDLAAASELQADLTGRLVAQVEVSEVLKRDLLVMVLLSIVVGWVVGVLIFRDIRAVVITNVVVPVVMIWTAGVYAVLGIALDSATVILPLLAAIIAFADAVHLVVPLQRQLQDGVPPRQALETVIRTIGPATALTSLTTTVAFTSLALAGGGLVNMAIMGIVAVVLAWISVMTVCPLLALAVARNEPVRVSFSTTYISGNGWKIAQLCIPYRLPLVIVALMLATTLALVQTQFRAVHDPASYLPTESAFLRADQRLSDTFAGSSTLFVRVPLAVSGRPDHPSNHAQLIRWHDALASAAQPGAVWSRAQLGQDLAALLPDNSGDLSADAAHALIAVRHPWDATDTEITALKDALRTTVQTLPNGTEAIISGISLAVSDGSKANIEQLRAGLFVSAFAAAGLVALASRSLSAGVGTGLAVTLAVLLVLTFGALPHGHLDNGLMVALIISVGIAIDDGIHLINYARHGTNSGLSPPRAFAAAVEKAGPAIVLSSVILIATLCVTQAADMPAIRSLGREIIAALAVALILTITVVPATTLLGKDLLAWLGAQKGSKNE